MAVNVGRNKRIDGRGVLSQSWLCLKQTKRKILVILSNRWNRNQKPRFLELDCDEQGNIHKQKRLPAQPRESRFHEVWENDEGRTEFESCFRFKRKYGHKLQKRA